MAAFVAENWRDIARLPDLRIHDLRHSFASSAIMDGVPLATIAKLLGHQLPDYRATPTLLTMWSATPRDVSRGRWRRRSDCGHDRTVA